MEGPEVEFWLDILSRSTRMASGSKGSFGLKHKIRARETFAKMTEQEWRTWIAQQRAEPTVRSIYADMKRKGHTYAQIKSRANRFAQRSANGDAVRAAGDGQGGAGSLPQEHQGGAQAPNPVLGLAPVQSEGSRFRAFREAVAAHERLLRQREREAEAVYRQQVADVFNQHIGVRQGRRIGTTQDAQDLITQRDQYLYQEGPTWRIYNPQSFQYRSSVQCLQTYTFDTVAGSGTANVAVPVDGNTGNGAGHSGTTANIPGAAVGAPTGAESTNAINQAIQQVTLPDETQALVAERTVHELQLYPNPQVDPLDDF